MKKVMKIVLILSAIILALGIAAFFYIKSMLPGGDGNNDSVIPRAEPEQSAH